MRDVIRARHARGEHPHDTGLDLLKHGDLEGAAEAFRHAITAHPEFPWSHQRLGDVLVRQRRWPDAVAAFRRAIELNPHFPPAYVGLADALAGGERWEEAIAVYRSALEREPDLAAAAKGLARALVRLAPVDLDEARRWYRRAHVLDPDDLDICHEAAGIRPVDPDLCVQFADSLARGGYRAPAIFYYQLALQLRSDDAPALAALARVLRLESEMDQALVCCRRAVSLAPGESPYHRLLGDLLEAQDRLGEAVAVYRRAAELDPGDASLHKRFGDLLAKGGDVRAASAAYTRAIELGFRSF